ncbi:MAG: stage II sporulation protein M [Chthoniobacter sp.]|nr:stage II sporulation protein M [Chthoniobacter sp.]
MIIDLPRFITAERPSWTELEKVLDRLQAEPGRALTLDEAKRFHFLYQKISADLARIATFASEPELRHYLEALTARAYAEIHETRERGRRFRPAQWFFAEFPRVFRRHLGAFHVSWIITIVGVLFGGFAVLLDDEAKEAIMPEMFANHLGDPAQRVAEEESGKKNRVSEVHASFASHLMANNIGVSIKAVALGLTYGIGTIILLFYNGVIVGLIGLDYIRAGQGVFLAGWLLPHGVIEIPAILIAGQGGLLLGKALVGHGDRAPLTARLRALGPDLATLIGGVAVMLVWAGFVESFLSQYHQPVIPYAVKIAFGCVELAVLVWFLSSGRKNADAAGAAEVRA